MGTEKKNKTEKLPQGVVLNAYPDSIGAKLSDAIAMLKRPEFKDVFSLFYILPTIFNSDLDRGFSVIDYDLNQELVEWQDLRELQALGVALKVDLVLNHLSVGSPQFCDLIKHGDKSEYKDFFIDWNDFWKGNGEMGPDGYIIPKPEYLSKLFMRKPELPILKVFFPDGSERPYWNTFYQRVDYQPVSVTDVVRATGLDMDQAERVTTLVNQAVLDHQPIANLVLDLTEEIRKKVLRLVESKRSYTGQMDLNAQSEKVWLFYEETFNKLKSYGAKLIRLDAFAYLHKQPGKVNFFNKPETWRYLDRLRELAEKCGLSLLPEIHCEYRTKLYVELAEAGYPMYDFFFPALVIDALDRGVSRFLIQWINEIQKNGFSTLNMLGCHDGIPVLDLKGCEGHSLLPAEDIEAIVERIVARGGRVKNLFGPDGKKIAYYQVNATFFSALGEDERKLLLARAIQMFMPGTPQIWYLDLFAGKNNYAAADVGGTASHKEINRTNLSVSEIEDGLKQPVVLKQLELIRLRNISPAFQGDCRIDPGAENELKIRWENGEFNAVLTADLKNHGFSVEHGQGGKTGQVLAQQ